MKKVLSIIGGIIAAVAIIPIESLSWWKWDIDPTLGNTFSLYVNAFGQFYKKLSAGQDYTIQALEGLYVAAGIVTILGAVLLFAGGAKGNGALAAIGGLIAIAGPVVFLISHGQDAGFTGAFQNVFFGNNDGIVLGPYSTAFIGVTSWYLNVGFFLPLLGGILGLASAK